MQLHARRTSLSDRLLNDGVLTTHAVGDFWLDSGAGDAVLSVRSCFLVRRSDETVTSAVAVPLRQLARPATVYTPGSGAL